MNIGYTLQEFQSIPGTLRVTLIQHFRPQSRLSLIAGRAWARETPVPRAKSPPAKRADGSEDENALSSGTGNEDEGNVGSGNEINKGSARRVRKQCWR